MLPRLTSLALFAVAAAVAASAVYWGLKLMVKAPALPAHASLAAASLPAAPDWSRLLGAEVAPPPVAVAVEPPPDQRYQLIGVVAPRAGSAQVRGGVALIAVDGKPARAFRVGAVVDGATVLQSVQPRAVALGPRGAPARANLQLPPLPQAATGSLPSASPPAEPASIIVPPPPSHPRSVPGRMPPQQMLQAPQQVQQLHQVQPPEAGAQAPQPMPGGQTSPAGRGALQMR
jgi:general secretion pathway protein C